MLRLERSLQVIEDFIDLTSGALDLLVKSTAFLDSSDRAVRHRKKGERVHIAYFSLRNLYRADRNVPTASSIMFWMAVSFLSTAS